MVNLNLCRSCKTDFGSVAAFDAHRVGSHAYLFAEGLCRVPPAEDGRRCLDVREIADSRARDGSLVFMLNERGQWSLRRSVESARSLRAAA